MNNRWNEIIYKIWSPVYDKIFNAGKFLEARTKIFQEEKFLKDQNILFVGVGTGADLEQVNHNDVKITAIDFSNEMLEKARVKFKDTSIQFFKMDALDMDFDDQTFDVVVGSLVLSVVTDPDKCLEEMSRVIKTNGEIIIFDKFAPKDNKPSLFTKSIRPLIKLLGTDIGISFEELYLKNREALKIIEDTPIMFKGMYRKIVLSKESRIGHCGSTL